MKKSLAELQAIRERTLDDVNLRTGKAGYRVVVGMATCGIAAGARPVLKKFMDLVENEGAKDVVVSQTGCIGMCRVEPIVEVINPQGDKVMYIKVNPEKAERIFKEHVLDGKIVEEYTMTVVDGSLIDPKIKNN